MRNFSKKKKNTRKTTGNVQFFLNSFLYIFVILLLSILSRLKTRGRGQRKNNLTPVPSLSGQEKEIGAQRRGISEQQISYRQGIILAKGNLIFLPSFQLFPIRSFNLLLYPRISHFASTPRFIFTITMIYFICFKG